MNEKDEITQVVEERMKQIQRQSMLLGSQAMCKVILQKITVLSSKKGRKTLRDYERLIADIEGFCRTGIGRKVNLDGTTEEKK